MIPFISFILGAGTAVIISSYDKNKYAIGGRVPTAANGEEYSKGGGFGKANAIIGALKLEKERLKDFKKLGKKWSSKEKRDELKKFKKAALKEYGKDIAKIQIDTVKKKAKFLAENPELFLKHGGFISIGSISKLVDFIQFNPTTAAAMTDEQLGKKYYLPTNVALKVRRAVKSNYTKKEIYEMLRK